SALITGAAQRVGRSLALHLAQQGWDIVLHYHRSQTHALELADELRAIGRQVALAPANLADPNSVTQIVEAAQGLPPITLLIHNASLFAKDTLPTLNADHLREHLQVNLETPLLLTRAFAERFPKGEQAGNVICLLDGMQGWSISPNFLSYSLSRLAMQEAIPLLASELAPHIRVNGIALGATLPGVMDKSTTFAKLEWVTPLRRTSHPQEVCDAVDFLLRADGVTGQIFNLSGGMNLARHHSAD
ncbi:MAG: SDR family NAD(P)-dependent oxidoreductase, partial [Rickettsiales bacterium]|nr:SDR family NAD(P)-dependent oxidoreductase [Rickettsiales bacterium]